MDVGDNNVGVSCEVIVLNGNKVLMGKRGDVFGKGSWAFPGGHLKVNERVEDCAKRELKEEVGIEPGEIKLIGIVNDLLNLPGQERQYIRFVFVVDKFKGEVKNLEPERCQSWEWFEKDNLPKPTFVGHVKVLELFLSKGGKFFLEK